MNSIKKLILILLILIAKAGYSGHFIGYEMTMVNIPSSDTYKVRLLFYRDNRPATVPMPTAISMSTYVQGTNANANVNFTLTRILKYPSAFDPKLCFPPISNGIIEVGIFEYTLTAVQAASLNNSNGYYFSNYDCCRGSGARNIQGSSDGYGINFSMDFPKISTGTYQYNSSPRFNDIPNNTYFVGTHYTLDWSCFDSNGDSLSYELVKSTPGNSLTKPFGTIDFNSNYSLTGNMLDGNPDITYNATTGVLDFKPTQAGIYLLAFKVNEWRKVNGVMVNIGSVTREIQFETVINSETAPILVDNNNRGGTIVDTVYVKDTVTYFTKLITHDVPGDSIFQYILPEQGLYNNILNSNFFDIQWGLENGVKYNASASNNVKLFSLDSMTSTFQWKIDSTDIKRTPYKFKIISKDESNCEGPYSDTLNYELYILGNCISTINKTYSGCDSVIDYFNNVHYTSITKSDTLLGMIGCDTIVTQIINVYPSAKSNRINGQKNIDDTTLVYLYGTSPQNNMQFDWTVSNGTIVSGQGTNIVEVKFSATDSAMLKYVAYNNLMCADSASLLVRVLVLGVSNTLGDKIKIFPNPTKDKIHITGVEKNKSTTIQIKDVQGKEIINIDIWNNQAIDISTLNKGIYILKVGDVVQRIVKL